MSRAMALLETSRLKKSFGGLAATNNVSLSVDSGEIRGLIGEHHRKPVREQPQRGCASDAAAGPGDDCNFS